MFSEFQFREIPHRKPGWKRAKTVRIPSGVVTKTQLLRVYGRELGFPSWVGENWDAFEEMLNTVGERNGAMKIRIWHAGCPLIGEPGELATYCQILGDVAAKSGADGVQYEILFRKSDREVMTRVLSEVP